MGMNARTAIIILFALLLAADASAAWYNASWTYRKSVTIDSSQVPSTQTDFPVLVKLDSDSDLASDAQADADDILFTSSNGTTKLSHEIEDFNSETGALAAWVKVPSLSGSASTTLYLYYGNAGASSQQDVNNVWDVNFLMVQHLNESPANDVNGHNDSTSNDNDGMPKNFDGTSTSTTNADGNIDGADVFDGTDDYVDLPASSSIVASEPFTLSAWIITDTQQGTWDTEGRIINLHRAGGSYSSGAAIYAGGPAGDQGGDADDICYIYYTGVEHKWLCYQTTSPVYHDGSGHLISVTHDGSTAKLYYDGVEVATRSDSFGDLGTATAKIGSFNTTTRLFEGTIDEARISNKVRDVNWISTSYNNQASPSTFLSLGSEETEATGNAPTVTLNDPDGKQVIGATHSVDFNVLDADNDQLSAALYYSADSKDFNIFIADLNLNDYSNYSGLSCDSTIWLTTTNCTYDWNLYRPGVSVKDAHLVLYMPLDTYSYRDFSLLANNGIATTFDKTASSGVVAGKQNRAFKFDGSDDYINVSDTDRLDLRSNDFSIELWASRSAADSNHVLVDKRADVENGYLLQFNADNKIEALICDGTCISITSTSTVTDASWHHIAVTFDRSANAQIYLDGSTDGGATNISGKSGSINTVSDLRIGARSYDPLASVMDGSIDEVRVYDKLLGAAEISTRYSNITDSTASYRIADGNFFLDLNVWDTGDGNAIDSSSTSFAVDGNSPTASDDAPGATQDAAFTVTFTCDDTSYIAGIQASGCSHVRYRKNSGSWYTASAVAINSDGNHLLEYYPVDYAGNEGLIYSTYAPLVLGGHTFSLGLKFDGNWRSSTVHIPGFISDQNMQDTVTQTLSQSENLEYLAFSLSSLLIGIASTGSAFTADITNSDPTLFNIYMQQVVRAGVDEEFFLVFTSGDYRAMEGNKTAIARDQFLKRTNPAFGVATTAIYTITIGLDYYDSNVDLNGNVHLGPGTHGLVVTNQGISGGKVVIQIERS